MNPIAAVLLAVTVQNPAGVFPPVDPAALARDPTLVGKEMSVDDRVRYFVPHKGPKGTQVFDELLLKRTDVVFRLPDGLRPPYPPRQPSARLMGTLRVEGNQLVFDVVSLELMPPDLERLDKELKRLAPDDAAGRARWATWAASRGKAFKEPKLEARGKEIEVESILMEADRPGADDLALARRVLERDLGDDLADALRRRGLAARLDRARTVAELTALATQVETLLPAARSPKAADGLADWKARVKTNPISAYRQAPPEVRAALDRDLLADVLARTFAVRQAQSPGDALTLADEAAQRLPDRPEVARLLRERGLASQEGGVGSMRPSEVEALAKTFRDDGQPERARTLVRSWLLEQRRRLNPNDAEGAVILAGQFEQMAGDRVAAGDLLREALRVEAQFKPALDALRKLGFRKSAEGKWFDPTAIATEVAGAAAAPDAPPQAPAKSGDSLRGMTLEQVRRRLGGKPDRIVRCVTQESTLEQWTYLGAKGRQVVNIRWSRGKSTPEVIAYYALP